MKIEDVIKRTKKIERISFLQEIRCYISGLNSNEHVEDLSGTINGRNYKLKLWVEEVDE